MPNRRALQIMHLQKHCACLQPTACRPTGVDFRLAPNITKKGRSNERKACGARRSRLSFEKSSYTLSSLARSLSLSLISHSGITGKSDWHRSQRPVVAPSYGPARFLPTARLFELRGNYPALQLSLKTPDY